MNNEKITKSEIDNRFLAAFEREVIKIEKRNIKDLKKFYQKKFIKYGATLNGVGWSKKIKSTNRYKTLLKIIMQDKINKNYSLLDVGCGYGELVNYLPKNKNYTYTGIDLVEEMISYAKKKNQKENFTFKVGNILKNIKKYDYIICNGVHTVKNNL